MLKNSKRHVMETVCNAVSVAASFISAPFWKVLKGIQGVPSIIAEGLRSVRHFPLIIKTCTTWVFYVVTFLMTR